MRRTWPQAGPVLTIISATTAIIALGLSSPVPRWVMFAWPALVIVWSLVVIVETRTNQQNRKTIDFQARVIRSQGELLARIDTEENDGRE
jgi:hypothetical protein